MPPELNCSSLCETPEGCFLAATVHDCAEELRQADELGLSADAVARQQRLFDNCRLVRVLTEANFQLAE